MPVDASVITLIASPVRRRVVTSETTFGPESSCHNNDIKGAQALLDIL
jgi:hypothetical protein